MTHAEKLARLLHVILWIAIVVTATLLVRSYASGSLSFQTKIDPQTRTSGLLVETDAGTGCQYIVTPWGGVVARTGPDGRQLCGPPQHP